MLSSADLTRICGTRRILFLTIVVNISLVCTVYVKPSFWKDKTRTIPVVLEKSSRSGGKEIRQGTNSNIFEDTESTNRSWRSSWSDVCSPPKVFHLTSKHDVELTAAPFSNYNSQMKCLANNHMGVFADKYAVLDNVLIDPNLAVGNREGGEEIESVFRQEEAIEYLTLEPGFFSIPCDTPPTSSLNFHKTNHLSKWAKSLACYDVKDTKYSAIPVTEGTVIAIQRYEYANLYCTMTEFYNTFVMMMLTGTDPSHISGVLLVDSHPKGNLDSAWAMLYGKSIRVKSLKSPVRYSRVIWSLLSYNSPLWNVRNPSVPYMEEFRHFFLTRHGASPDHTIDCSRLNVTIIWRHDYVAHPRNPSGKVIRKFYNEPEILDQVKKTLGPSATVTGVQLDKFSMKDQVKLASTCDLLIGMHGAGLAHTMFLPRTSGFLEIFPPNSYPSVTHFKVIGIWRKLKFIQFHNSGMANAMSNGRTKINLDLLHTNVQKLRNDVCPNA